jgi:hypothetical protein
MAVRQRKACMQRAAPQSLTVLVAIMASATCCVWSKGMDSSKPSSPV